MARADRSAPRSSAFGAIRANAAATVFLESHGDGDRIERHHHDYAQIVGLTHGLARVNTPTLVLIVPPMHAVFLPAGIEHEIRLSGTAKLIAACITDAEAFPDRTTRVFGMTPLLAELLHAAARFSADHPADGPESRLISVLIDQTTDELARTSSRNLAMPVSPPLRAIAEGLLRDPADKRTLDEWGELVGASVRTLERRFREETGVTFSQWRRQLQLSEAFARLSAGEAVNSVALVVGYATPSAFIKAFRDVYDISPARLAGRGPPQAGGNTL